jgi:hypothetical protein
MNILLQVGQIAQIPLIAVAAIAAGGLIIFFLIRDLSHRARFISSFKKTLSGEIRDISKPFKKGGSVPGSSMNGSIC